MSTFCSSRCVAKLWRSVCMDTRLSMCAASAAAWMARFSCRVLSGSIGIEPGKQPAAVEHLALGTGHAPPDAQALEQHRREHRVAILAALALLDAQRHALAVDVADLQRHHFAGAQPGAVGDRQRRLVLQVAGRGDQARAPHRG